MPPRARIRGIPLSPIIVRSVAAPGVGGVVTDAPSWELSPQQMPTGTDAIFPKGVISLRGPYIQASASAVLGAPASHFLTSVAAVDLPSYGGASGQPASPVIVAAQENGVIGMVQAATPNGSAGQVGLVGSATQALLLREVYKGECLFCPQDGLTPIARFAGAPAHTLAANVAAAGSVTFYQGTSFVLGVGTNFSTQAQVGTYITLNQFPGQSRLVVSIDQDGSGNWVYASVDGTFPITTGIPAPPTAPTPLFLSQPWGSLTPTRLGTIGLCTPVQTLGQASITTGLGTTVSGFGTLWNSANLPPGQGRPRANDYIGITGNSYPSLSAISAVSSDTTLLITAGPGNDWANRPYVIYRNAVGREARYHQGRLYITGVDWDNTGVYYMPVNSPLGAFYNPDQPTATITSDYPNSQMLLKFDVPIKGAQGRNVALLSTPQGLLILRTDNAYLSMGDPPTNTVIEVAHGAGCIDIRSACVGNRGEGAFWAGQNGIYRYVGGRVIDLTEGRRNREWRQKMSAFLVDYAYGGVAAFVSCGVVDSHLFIAVNDTLNNALCSLWVYDLMDNAFVGDFSGATGISSMSMYRSTTLAGSADDLYFTTTSTMSGVDRSQALHMGGIARDEGGAGTSAFYGTFSIDIPESVVGAINDLSRVIELKIVYELVGGDGTTKLRVQSNVDGGAFGLDVDLPTTANGPQEVRIMPVSDVTAPSAGALGLLGRRHALRLSQVGTKPSTLRVHAVDFVVRPRRPRA